MRRKSVRRRSEEHTSELQSHRDLHSFPTRRSSDLIEAASLTSYTLYLALQDYLACLDKWCIDAQEERQTRGPRNGLPLEQWRAEGEAQELPKIVRLLSRMAQAHTPDFVRHTLS